MTVAFRRGACPALSAPMPTGDGLLVRLALTGEALTPAQLTALCAAAARHGNGMVEITARGNFQIRGLTPLSAPLLADEIAAMKLGLRDGVPVETGPLAGLDPDENADPRPLANAIRSAIDATDLASRLGPKVSVVIDGGGRFGMSEIAADIRLTAVPESDTVRWQIAVGGDAATAAQLGFLGNIADAESATLSLLETIASHGPAARARDLHFFTHPISLARREMGNDNGRRQSPEPQWERQPDSRLISPQVGEMSGRTEGGDAERNHPTNCSPLSLTDGRFAIAAALPFGSIHADELAAFADNAAGLDAGEIRFAHGRRLILLCALEASAVEVRETAANAGLITEAADSRANIFACPGCPDCASGHIAARAIASSLPDEWTALLGDDLELHISGCAKGCAHPAKAALTLVGDGERTALVMNGSARDSHAASVSTGDLAAALARLAVALPQSTQDDTQRLAAAFAGD